MKRLLVTGSIAYDRIAVFRDRFSNHILPDKIHRLNVSFLVEDMTVNLGGTGGNIAYNLGLLGENPLLLGAAGDDFDLYEKCLQQNHIETRYIKKIPGLLTAHTSIMTDLDDNQIASFYPGANAHAKTSSVDDVTEEVALAIIAPNDKEAMLGAARSCRKKNIPFIADPGQMMLALDAKELDELIEGALGVIANDYEWQLITDKSGLDEKKILKKAQWLIVTYAEHGARLWNADGKEEIPIVKPAKVVDPTGCGDAFRAGLMYGIKNRHTLKNSAHMGSWLASRCVEQAGTQNHTLDEAEWKKFINHL